MEFNADLLEIIVLGRVNSDDLEQYEETKADGSPRMQTERAAHSSPTPPVTRKDINGKASIRLNPSQLLEVKALSNASTPRATATKESSSGGSFTPRATPRGSGVSTPRGGNFAEDPKNRKQKTLFDELSGKIGLENAMKWFELQSMPIEHEMSEAQFMQFLQSLTKFYDWEVYEILDILGTPRKAVVTT